MWEKGMPLDFDTGRENENSYDESRAWKVLQETM